MTKLDSARALAARGFKVFPIKAGAKHPPLWRDWPNRATTEPDRAKNWPVDANVGIHCAGLVVLDVDVRSGGDASLAALADKMPATLTTLTPTGGRHLFYRLPEGHPGVPNGANKLGPGIDVKSTRGYVLAPGSEVPAGRYRFEADAPIADAPEWLMTELGTTVPKTGMSTSGGQTEIVDAAPEVLERASEWLKGRPVGDEAFKTACGLRDFGLSLHQALALLESHDGRPADILLPKVQHAYRYAQNAPGSKAASAEDFPTVEVLPKRERSKQKPLRLSELAGHPPGPYLVKGLLQRGSDVVVYGAPGAGKTFVTLDLAFHIAAGKAWRERRVHQGVVLYLAYEGIGGLAKRAEALLRHHKDTTDVPLYVVGADYNLREQAGRQALGADLAQLPEKPVLVVIDTLARAMKGGDENSAQDMGALNDAVSALIQATGACVIRVHHSGKNKAGGARGSSALLGAIDTEIEVDARQIVPRKQRDIEPCEPLGFKLTPVVVGLDADGDEITSCVVEPAATVVERTAGLRGNAQLVWGVVCDVEDNAPFSKDLLRAQCDEFLPERNTRQAFYRAFKTLLDRGLIERTEDGKYVRKME